MGGLSRKAKWLKGKNKKNGYEERRKIIMGKGEEEWLWGKEKDNVMGKGEEEELWEKEKKNDYGERRKRMIMGKGEG